MPEPGGGGKESEVETPDSATETGDTEDTGAYGGVCEPIGEASPIPNRGVLQPQVEIDVGAEVESLLAADLDGDGDDEVIVEVEDALWVLQVDLGAGTMDLTPLDATFERSSRYDLGNGQILEARSDDTSRVLGITWDGVGWVVDAEEMVDPLYAGMSTPDLDGDGITDVLVSEEEGYQAWAVPGPLEPVDPRSGVLLWVPARTEAGAYDVTDGVAFGDVDCDGNVDLVYTCSGEEGTGSALLRGPLSPASLVERDDCAGLGDGYADYGDYFPVGRAGIADDLDDDGWRELTAARSGIQVYDELATGDAPTPFSAKLALDEWVEVAGAPTEVMAALGRSGPRWWYGSTPATQSLADAEVDTADGAPVVLGRFQHQTRIDAVWAEGTVLYGVPGSGGLVGEDPDRDGVVPPEDCDDDDHDVHPGAIELVDGVDQDCDGETDEGPPLVNTIEAITGEYDESLGGSLAAWSAGAHDAIASSNHHGAPGVYDLVSGTYAARFGYGEGPEARGGDLNGDGIEDMLAVGGTIIGSAVISAGPSDGARDTLLVTSCGAWGRYAWLGDLDADGTDDLLYDGTEWLADLGYVETSTFVFGSSEGAYQEVRTEAAYDGQDLYGPVGPMDANGDGYADLLWWVDWQELSVHFGPFDPATMKGLEQEVVIAFPDWTEVSPFGTDGGLKDDLAIGWPEEDRVDVAFGPWAPGAYAAEDVVAVSIQAPTGTDFGESLHVWGNQLLVGAPAYDFDRGAVWGYRGAETEAGDFDAASFVAAGTKPGESVGESVAIGDFDGDGVDDVALGAHGPMTVANEGQIRVYAWP